MGITGPLDLVLTPLSESNAEHPQTVTVSSLHIHMSFNHSLPFPYQRPQLVCCKIHSLKFLRNKKKALCVWFSLETSNKQCWQQMKQYNSIIPRNLSAHSSLEHLQLSIWSFCMRDPHHPEGQPLISQRLYVWVLLTQSVRETREVTFYIYTYTCKHLFTINKHDKKDNRNSAKSHSGAESHWFIDIIP